MIKNIFKDIPDTLPDEFFEIIHDQANIKIERIVSLGHFTPKGEWYDQDWHEWVVLLTGAATLRINGQNELIDMVSGDHIMLPAHLRHRVEWTDPDTETVWLAVHFSGREEGASEKESACQNDNSTGS